MAARSSCRAASSDAFNPTWLAEAPSREGRPAEAGRVIDMGTFQNPAPSYDGAKAGDPSLVRRVALVREAETGGHNHFVRLRLAVVVHVECLRRIPEPLVLDAGVNVPRAV